MDRLKLRDLLRHISDRNKTTFREISNSMCVIGKSKEIEGFDDDIDELQKHFYEKFKETFLKEREIKVSRPVDFDHVYLLILSLANGSPFEKCHPLEAFMICEWSGAGMRVFKKFTNVYGLPAINDTIQHYLSHDLDEPPLLISSDADEALSTLSISGPEVSSKDAEVDDKNPVPKANSGRLQYLPNGYISFEQAIKNHSITVQDLSALNPVRELQRVKRLISQGNYVAAEDIIYQIRDLAETRSDYKSDILHHLGVIRTFQAKYTEAAEYLNEAYDLGSTNQKTPILGNLGLNAIYQSNLHLASQYFVQGLEQSEDPITATYMLSSLGNIAHSERRFIDARKLYYQAEQQAKEIGALNRLAYLFLNSGGLYFDQKQFHLSEVEFTKSLGLVRKLGNIALYTELWWNIGLVTAALGDIPYGKAQLNQTARDAHDAKLWHFEIAILLDLAKLELIDGNQKLAFDLFNQVFSQLSAVNTISNRTMYGILCSITQRSQITTNVPKLAIHMKENLTHAQLRYIEQYFDNQTLLLDCQEYMQRGAGVALLHPYNMMHNAIQHLSLTL